MKLTIKAIEAAAAVLTEDGIFKCRHDNVIIEKPCCNGVDCGCGGSYSVWCDDCRNEDMTDRESESILEGALYE